MPKKKVAEVNNKQDEKLQAFLKDYEAAVQELVKKYELRIVPRITSNEFSIQAVFGVEKVQYVDVDKNIIPTNEAQPETN
jgi:hypothetical protein